MKILFYSIWLTLFFANIMLGQLNPDLTRGPMKERDITEIVLDKYIIPSDRRGQSDAYDRTISEPVITVDTLVVISPKRFDSRPMPTMGLQAMARLVSYPEIARRAYVDGKVEASATIDTAGRPKNITIRISDWDGFDSLVIGSITTTRFIPAQFNGQPIESHVNISFHFGLHLHTRVNPEINTIIVNRDPGFWGSSSGYSVRLTSDGAVTYEGTYKVERMGKWKSTLDTNQFKRVASLFLSMGFLAMPDYFETGTTDHSSVSVQVTSRTATKDSTWSTTKKVRTDFYLPIYEIATLVELITDKLNWEKVKD